MAESVHDRVNRYLADTIAAEENFEAALNVFGQSGIQEPVQQLLFSFAAKAETQHKRLKDALDKRGGTPSKAKTALAQMLAFTPLSAQMGQGSAEKNTQHLMVTYAAAAAEMAMYESLAEAASGAGDGELAMLARTLQSEEQQDHRQVWNLLRHSARESFQAELEKGKNADALMRTYLEEAIAAEKSFETQLNGFAKETSDPSVRELFTSHAQETRAQYERLTARLNVLKGSPSLVKSMLAHMFAFAPKIAQTGHDAEERLTQNLMMAYAVENAEVAMYESMAEVAHTSGDAETEQMALAIQQQEKATAGKIWPHIAPAARRSISVISTARAS
jgi:ferritin-like metal-binding protein YciE